jgi:hypothetical protein
MEERERPRKESKPPGSRCTSSRMVVVVNHDTGEAENPAAEWEGRKKNRKRKKEIAIGYLERQ